MLVLRLKLKFRIRDWIPSTVSMQLCTSIDRILIDRLLPGVAMWPSLRGALPRLSLRPALVSRIRAPRSVASFLAPARPLGSLSALPAPAPLSRLLSSSTAGFDISEAMLGAPSNDLVQPRKGGRARKSQAGVLAIKNSWNNTIVTISDVNYKTKGWVSGGVPPARDAAAGEPALRTPGPLRVMARLVALRLRRLQESEALLDVRDGEMPL